MKTPLAYSARALVLAAAFAVAAPAIAQDSKPGAAVPVKAAAPAPAPTSAPAPTPAAPVAVKAPTWSDAELGKIGAMLVGSWTSAAPIDGVTTTISVAHVAVDGMTDTLYFESARAETPWRPYRHGIWHLAKDSKGTVHLRTMEFRRAGGRLGSAVGTWAAPAAFPSVKADDLVTTMDVVIKSSPNGFAGASEHSYPTSAFGAASMSSALELSDAGLKTADRGFDLAGKKVWGPEEGQSYTFNKGKPSASVKDLGDGLFVVEYNTQAQGKTSQNGDLIDVHYVGYLGDGKVFDSSYDRGSPMKYAMGGRLIEGWNRAMVDLVPGQHKRLIIPGALAYGERGRPGVIPANSTLFFDIEVVDVQPAPAQPPQPDAKANDPKANDPKAEPRANTEPKRDMKDSGAKQPAPK